MQLKINHWGCPYDTFDHGIYLSVIKDNKIVWSSNWYDSASLFEGDIKELRQEFHDFCQNHHVNCIGTDSNDYWEWKIAT